MAPVTPYPGVSVVMNLSLATLFFGVIQVDFGDDDYYFEKVCNELQSRKSTRDIQKK